MAITVCGFGLLNHRCISIETAIFPLFHALAGRTGTGNRRIAEMLYINIVVNLIQARITINLLSPFSFECVIGFLLTQKMNYESRAIN